MDINKASHLKAVVKATHEITIKEELKKWIQQSIRVESCVLLSDGGRDVPFINTRLL